MNQIARKSKPSAATVPLAFDGPSSVLGLEVCFEMFISNDG
jgi:hypothetical protein